MKITPMYLLGLLGGAFSKDAIMIGVLKVSKIENFDTHCYLLIENERLVVSDRLSIFDFKMGGVMEYFESYKYLQVDEVGRLILGADSDPGFSLDSEKDSTYKQTLSYQGNSTFVLCRDGSVNYGIDCDNARYISITYEEIFH